MSELDELEAEEYEDVELDEGLDAELLECENELADTELADTELPDRELPELAETLDSELSEELAELAELSELEEDELDESPIVTSPGRSSEAIMHSSVLPPLAHLAQIACAVRLPRASDIS